MNASMYQQSCDEKENPTAGTLIDDIYGDVYVTFRQGSVHWIQVCLNAEQFQAFYEKVKVTAEFLARGVAPCEDCGLVKPIGQEHFCEVAKDTLTYSGSADE